MKLEFKFKAQIHLYLIIKFREIEQMEFKLQHLIILDAIPRLKRILYQKT